MTAATPGAPDEARQYLTFMLNGETFAIGILAIKEIIEFGGVTPVPMMPPTKASTTTDAVSTGPLFRRTNFRHR